MKVNIGIIGQTGLRLTVKELEENLKSGQNDQILKIYDNDQSFIILKKFNPEKSLKDVLTGIIEKLEKNLNKTQEGNL